MPCSWVLFRTVILVVQSGTVLLAIYSTLEGCKPKTKVQTDVLDELLYADDMDKNASSEAKNAKSYGHVITMISQSAQKDRGDEVTARIAKASVAFGRLRANVWGRNGIKLDIKLKV